MHVEASPARAGRRRRSSSAGRQPSCTPGTGCPRELEAFDAPYDVSGRRWRQRSPRREETPTTRRPWRSRPRRGPRGVRRRGVARRPARRSRSRPRTGPPEAAYGRKRATATTYAAGRRQLGGRRGPGSYEPPVQPRRPRGRRGRRRQGRRAPASHRRRTAPRDASARPRWSGRWGCLRYCRYSERNAGGGGCSGGLPADGYAPAATAPAAVPSRPPAHHAHRPATGARRLDAPRYPARAAYADPPRPEQRAPWRPRRPCRRRRSW